MKFRFPLQLTLFFLSFPIFGETIYDLVKRDDLFYKKFSDAAFTGKIEGLVQGSFEDGLTEGPWVEYHDNGQLWFKGNYKYGKREGPWVGYHDNSQLWFKGNYKDGNREGPSFRYYSDGRVQPEGTGTFKNGEKISD